ncbi:unnamed protein product, partial [Pylaiella littoralis]
DGKGRTPLYLASIHGDAPSVMALLAAGGRFDINAKDAKGRTPLLRATIYNHCSAVDALCAHGADLGIRAKVEICFPFFDCAALDVASFYGYVDIMKALLKHGSDVNAQAPGHQSALNKAAEGNQVAAIDVLMAAGAVAHCEPGFDGPFQRAMEGEACNAVRALARHGIDPDWHEGHSQTPLQDAVRRRDLGTVKALLAVGASPNVSGSSRTVLFDSIECSDSEPNYRIVRLLLDHGASVDARNDDDGETALHAAVEWCNCFAVDMLVKAGANVNAETREGQTPLHHACMMQDRDTIECLLRHGAVINTRDNDGCSILHAASTAIGKQEISLELVDFLLIAGADETVMDNNGNTPASHLLLEPTDREPRGVLREQIRELLVRAPADRADRVWRRRGMLLMCHGYPDKASQEPDRSRATKSPRTTEAGGTADGT